MKEFEHKKKNIYIDRKKYELSDDEGYLCSCEKHPVKSSELKEMSIPFDAKKEEELFSCGKRCLNKMVSWECVEHLCPAGISCRNRRFQQHLYEEVYPIKTDSRGWGLCAGDFLPKGTFVMQYIGEVYSIDSPYGLGKLKEYRNRTCTYLMSISKNEVIDPTYKGNLARFINHSCEPNCQTQKWNVLGEICVGIFTLRDIHEGEELTFNYGFDILKTTFQKCLCGARNCKGYLGIVEPTKGLTNSILCDVCKNGCRGKEIIVVCDSCKKIFHKNCIKRTKERKILESIKNYDVTNNSYLCNSCIKKRDRDTTSNPAISALNNPKKDIANPTNSNNIVNSLNNLSLSTNQISEIKEKYKDKKSSQELISELKKKKLKKGIQTSSSASQIQDVSSYNLTSNQINEECESNAESYEVAQANKEYIMEMGISLGKVDPAYNTTPSNVVYANENSSVGAYSNKLKTVKTIEEEEIIDASIEVSEMDIKKIQTSLNILSNIGARLFWDYRQLSNLNLNNMIEVKITGTQTQIDKVKEEIKKIIAEKEVTLDSYSTQINVPKLFVRRIIGHQSRNLISYKSKYGVEIEFDTNLITDDIFQIGENSQITIKGRDHLVKFVEKDIKRLVYNLKVLTIFLMPTDYNYVRNNICQLKTSVDPADLRLRKREYKIDRDIKHSFYYVPSNHKDLVVIGYESEIKKAGKIIKEFLLRQNTLNFNYSLCVLCPTYYSSLIDNFRNDFSNLLREKNMMLKVYDPVFSRKHLNIYIEGKWKDITELKEMLFKYLNEKEKVKIRGKSSISEFEQYAFNQEHKLISKNLRKFFLESNYLVKNWDLISEDIWQNMEGVKSDSKQKKDKDDYSKLIREFTKYSDRDTTMNYLLHLPAGAYNSVFSMSKLEVTRNLIDYVGDNLESYQSTLKLTNERREKQEMKSEIFRSAKIETEEKREQTSVTKEEGKYNMIIMDDELMENLSEDESGIDRGIIDEEDIDIKPFNKNESDVMRLTELLLDTNNNNKEITQNSTDMSIDNLNNLFKLNSTENFANITNTNLFNVSLASDRGSIRKESFIPISTIQSRPTIQTLQDANLSYPNQFDKNSTNINNHLMNNSTISTIDNIQSALLNKLNEIRNENKLINNEMTNINSNNSVKSNESGLNKNGSGILPNCGIVVTDDLNILKTFTNSQNPTINASMNPTETMNISYNFSNINQMNINININSIKDLMNESSINPYLNNNQKPESFLGANAGGEMNPKKDIEKESVISLDINPSKYDKYEKYDKHSDRNRDKDYKYLRKKIKPTHAIEYKRSRHSYYTKTYDKDRDRDKDRNFNIDRDKDRNISTINNDYGYFNKSEAPSTSRYSMTRRYYNSNASGNPGFSNYNYNKNKRTSIISDNVSKSYYKSNHTFKKENSRLSRSKSNSGDLFSRGNSRSNSVKRGLMEDKSESYSIKAERSKYNYRKRNTNMNANAIINNEGESNLKNKKDTIKSSSQSHSDSSQSKSLRSSSSSSPFSSSSSSRSLNRDFNQVYKTRNRGGLINSHYKSNNYNRMIHYTNNKPIFRHNFYGNNTHTNSNDYNSISNYNTGYYQSQSFNYENSNPYQRPNYYKLNNHPKVYNNFGGKYYNNYYANRYNRYIRRSRSNSRSKSRDKFKEFLRLKKKESEILVENRESSLMECEKTSNNFPQSEIVQLKSCLRKPSSYN